MDIRFKSDSVAAEIGNYIIIHFGKAIIAVIIGLICVKIILYILRRVLNKSGADKAMMSFIVSAAKVALFVLLAVVVMSELGIPTATFITALGACGVAIALALKDSLANVAGGIMIIVNKPFAKDDYIKLNEFEGNVSSVELMTTTLNTVDGKKIIIPNGIVDNSILINYTRNGFRRVDCIFSIAPDDDIMTAKSTLRQVCSQNGYVLDDPETVIAVDGYGAGSIDIVCYVWCENGNYYDTRYSVYEQAKEALDREGITVPYNGIKVAVESTEKKT